MTTIQVRLPLPQTRASDWRGASMHRFVGSSRVAIVNDGWGSSDDLAIVLERLLSRDYGVTAVSQFRANSGHARSSERTSSETQEALLARVVASSDSAIVMLGNCGSCTAWTCNTSAELSRRGVKSAAVVTGLFRPEAEFLLARANKVPEHPLIVLDDRFEFSDPAVIEEAALRILSELFGESHSVGPRAETELPRSRSG